MNPGPQSVAGSRILARWERGPSPEIIGRRVELAAMADALERAAAGDPQLVVVGGAAGVGKSRLVAEFSRRARTAGARVLVGDCLELVGGGLPFGPIAAILREAVRTTPADQLARLLGPARPELARLVPELSTGDDSAARAGPKGTPPGLSGPDVDATRAQVRLFEHLLGVLGRLGADAPTVVILEDVHWIDPSSRDLASFLVRSLRDERVMLVLTFRTEYLPRNSPEAVWLADLNRSPRMLMLTLEPFSAGETDVQLGAILGAGPDPALSAEVHRRSEGNPLFNEELLAAIRQGSDAPPGCCPTRCSRASGDSARASV